MSTLAHSCHSISHQSLRGGESAATTVCKALAGRQQVQLEAMELEIRQALDLDDMSSHLQNSLHEVGLLLTQARLLLKIAARR